MQNYIGVKMIKAEPEERNGKAGYRVIYPGGYESWSPADVFESAYLPISRGDRLTDEDIASFLYNSKLVIEKRGEKSTLVEVEMPTGWKDFEVSSCVDPGNYDEELGKEYALENIEHRLWKYLGFVLQWANHGLKK